MSGASATIATPTRGTSTEKAPLEQLILWHPCHEHPLFVITGAEAYPRYHGIHYCNRCGLNGGTVSLWQHPMNAGVSIVLHMFGINQACHLLTRYAES